MPEQARRNLIGRRRFVAGVSAVVGGALVTGGKGSPVRAEIRPVYIVPNFHPASCGWLTNFSKERIYCANRYLDHLDRVRDDPQYAFVFSEVRRGIPYGFSHGAWARPNSDLHGWPRGIVPAVRWSHYTLAGGGGVALLDRGLTSRELNERTPVIYLLNATDKYYGYPNAWLSGKGKHPPRGN